jgi:hypothetical protein
MKQVAAKHVRDRSGELGGSRVKFLLVLAVLGYIAYSLYVFLPVAYDNWLFKDLMQHNVDVASVTGHPPEWVKDQLTKAGPEFHVPPEAVITVSQAENRVVVNVQYFRPIPFPGFTYNYKFDHTARSTAFLSIK